MESFDLKICSMRVRVRSNDERFVRYARAHFAPVLVEGVGEPEVAISFERGRPGALADLMSDHEKVCRGVHVNDREIVWSEVPYLEGLRMTCARTGDVMEVEAKYAPPASLKRTLRKTALAFVGRAGSPNRFYFELMYNLVYYPVFWRLRRRGIFLMHGGGVAIDGVGVVIVGAQGTGKSTLIAQLLARPGSEFISDNLILFDPRRVYACHEPLRIDTGMLSRMPHLNDVLERVDVPVPLGRTAFNVARNRRREEIVPAIFIVPAMSRAETNLRPLPKETVIEWIRCFNTLADEVRSFEVFASVLCLASPSPAAREAETSALEALLGAARCFEMNVKYGEHPGETAAKLDAALLQVRSG
jgi:hypothetical protein